MARKRAVTVDDKRSAIEHELVLAADLIDVDQRNSRIDHALARQRQALVEFPHFERRAVRNQEQLRAEPAKVRRDQREPDVLADRKADGRTAKDRRLRQRTWREHALLVEDAVVWQLVLETKLPLAVCQQCHRVVETATLSPWCSDDNARS